MIDPFPHYYAPDLYNGDIVKAMTTWGGLEIGRPYHVDAIEDSGRVLLSSFDEDTDELIPLIFPVDPACLRKDMR